MSKADIAKNIIAGLGGEENIGTFTHCATRLRFEIKDRSKIKETDLKAIKEVIGIVDKNGIYQLVIGPNVTLYYNELLPFLQNTVKAGPADDDKKQKEKSSEKKSIGGEILGYISGSISPVLPILIGSGMINALLAIAVLFGMSKDNGTYMALTAIANVGLTYLPVFVAFSAAKRLHTHEYISAMLALAMVVCFNQQEGMSLFGLAIPNVKYANGIIPVLMMVPVLAVVDKLFTEHVPAATHFTLKPLVLLVVMAPVILFVFGPIGAIVGAGLANMCIWLMDSVGSLALAVLSFLHPLTVMTGMHYLFTPVMANEVAETGYTFVLGRALAANYAMAGAAFAVGVKAKKTENKNIGFSTGITALISVTEPALYGCLLRLRRPLISACAAAGLTGIFLGIFQVRAYSIASPSLFSMPIFIGGDGMSNFFLAIAGAALGFLLGFIITWIVGFKED